MGGRFGLFRLSNRLAESAGPGTYNDGGGLLLVVKKTGRRSWIYRYQIDGKRRDMGLGPYPAITLKRARELAGEARALKAEKKDPLDAKKRVVRLTFKQAAEATIESKRPGWRSEKHADQWASTLAAHVYPKLGNRNVAGITTEDVLAVLRPIWTTTPETASRVRQRIEAVLSYARVAGARDGENPAAWRGRLDHALPKPTKVRAVRHFAAMDWRQIPEFWSLLCEQQGVAALALRFVILTAARSGEVRGMSWAEVEGDVWSVPGERMKAGRPHRVPLAGPALAVLALAKPLDRNLVFPGQRRHNPLSDMSLTAVLRRMAEAGQIDAPYTVHGFRSSFRDWAAEATSHPREIAEHCLAHRVGSDVERAYARSDLLERRRKLLEDWANFVASSKCIAV